MRPEHFDGCGYRPSWEALSRAPCQSLRFGRIGSICGPVPPRPGIKNRSARLSRTVKMPVPFGSRFLPFWLYSSKRIRQLRRPELMKLVPVLTGIAGLVMIGGLVGYFDASAVMRSLRAIGWAGFLAICAIHLGVISLEGIAWRMLVSGKPVWAFIWGRLIRDAGSEVLPVSQMGGCVLGARAVALAGVSGTIAAATTMVDL